MANIKKVWATVEPAFLRNIPQRDNKIKQIKEHHFVAQL
jgi:hypothetical protein